VGLAQASSHAVARAGRRWCRHRMFRIVRPRESSDPPFGVPRFRRPTR
jgi:hypothetical protein